MHHGHRPGVFLDDHFSAGADLVEQRGEVVFGFFFSDVDDLPGHDGLDYTSSSSPSLAGPGGAARPGRAEPADGDQPAQAVSAGPHAWRAEASRSAGVQGRPRYFFGGCFLSSIRKSESSERTSLASGALGSSFR